MVLGLVLGLAVVVVFVFESSEDTIDAARISGLDTEPRPGLPLGGPARVPLIRVVNGRPPPGGPVRVDFKQGQTARFVIDSDEAIRVEVSGYGVSRTLEAGRTLVTFRASERGQYPIVVTPSNIDIATLRVARR